MNCVLFLRRIGFLLPRLVSAALIVGAFVPIAVAQMKTGEEMKDFAEVFGVQLKQRSYPFSVALVECSAPGNILFPGEQPTLTLQIVNQEDKPIDADATVRVIEYSTRGIPGNIWLPEVYKIAEVGSVSVHVQMGRYGFSDVKVTLQIPPRFGAYAVVVDLEGKGRRFATSLVRTFATASERLQYPKFSLDHLPDPVLSRLGVQAVRYGLNYVPSTSKEYPKWREQVKRELDEMRAHNITALLMFMNGVDNNGQPLGRPRPHLDADGGMLSTKSDTAWLPELDTDFEKVVADLCWEFGWPKGPATAVSLWNEPWEGISISGWGADALRYREIYRAMAHGVETARKKGVEVLIAGCDSSSNTLDKLFSDGSDEFLKWLDVCSIHYQGLSAPTLYKAWINRQSPFGRVRIWDTESWIANTDDRVAAVIAGTRAAGYDRAMGIFGGNISQPVSTKRRLVDGTSQGLSIATTWSVAAAVGAAQHFIGERDFHELLFKQGLPWIFVFDGLNGNGDDGSVVVVGDLGEAFGRDGLPFRTVLGLSEAARREELGKQLKNLPVDDPGRRDLVEQTQKPGPVVSGKMTLKSDPTFRTYDFYGNNVVAETDGIAVPLDHRGFFLRTDGSKGSFARLVKALREARIEGYEPLEVIMHDATTPLDHGGAVTIQFTNILNRPIHGVLQATLGGLKIHYPSQLVFEPHETKQIALQVDGGDLRPDNTYPLALSFDAGRDGRIVREEDVHVNVVARRTITVDGNLEDWKGVLPQTVHSVGDAGPSLTEAAWFPFAKFDRNLKSGFATGYFAYDDRNFYFAAKIGNDMPDQGTFRFASLDEEQFFYPKISYELDPEATLFAKEETWDVASRRSSALVKPDRGSNDRNLVQWTSPATAFAFDLDLPANRFTQIGCYFVDTDDYEAGRRRTAVQITDRKSGRLLSEQLVEKSGFGTYAIFVASGEVRITIRTKTWLPPSLAGIFFDPVEGTPPDGNAVSARFNHFDDQTGADWRVRYGRDGYVLPGIPSHFSSDVRATLVEKVSKKEHRWPDGVRQYSYRKRPVLPSGNAPKFDNVQLAFGVRGLGEGNMIAAAPGTMPGYVPTECTDYEYALNVVAPAYGGGTEIWRLQAPRMPRKQFYPRQPKCPLDGPVKDGQLVVRQEGNTRFVEAAIPWTEIPLVRQAIDAGKPVRLSFRVNASHGASMELTQGRSVAPKNSLAFHADWIEHWDNTLEFGFER
ncbi:MAG TPA: hypothetical protein VKC60_17665 [Opitutaceae bacterium]|nr:hypothetical protein [Opitutaceae bacterium]